MSQSDQSAVGSSRSRVLQAAGVVAAAFIISRLVGWIRDALFGFYFGIETPEAIAYIVANRFPELIFNVIVGGALGSAFIPTFAGYFARDDEDGAWHLFAAIINLVVVVTIVIAAVTFLLAPIVARYFLPPEGMVTYPELLPLTTRMLRVMLLSPIIFGVSGVVMGALNARQHFLMPALAGSAYNIGIIIGIVVFAPNVMGAAYGTVLGALGHLVIQLPTLRKHSGRYAFVLTLKDPGVLQVLKLMAPRILGLSFSYINPVVILFLTRLLTVGSQVALERAFRVMLMPYSILGQAMGVAAFPTLSTLAAEEKWAEMRQILSDSIRSILFLGLPISAGLMVLRRPLVSALYEYGRFDSDATRFVAWALLFYAFGMIALAILEVVSRSFYALGDTVTPVIAGVLQLPTMALLGWWLSTRVFTAWGWLDFGGLALGYSISNFLEIGVLLVLLNGRLKGLNGRLILDGLWRMSIATGVMVIVVSLVQRVLPVENVYIQLLLGAAVGAITYGGISLGLQVSELTRLLSVIQRRILKR